MQSLSSEERRGWGGGRRGDREAEIIACHLL
jgi:hypothetical protein